MQPPGTWRPWVVRVVGHFDHSRVTFARGPFSTGSNDPPRLDRGARLARGRGLPQRPRSPHGVPRMDATTIARDQLKTIVERIERLEEEKQALSSDIKDVYAEAKANGFDTK